MKKIYLFILICLCSTFFFGCTNDNMADLEAVDEKINDSTEIILSGSVSFDTIPMQSIDEAIGFTDYIAKVRILERSATRLLGGYTLDDLLSLLEKPWTRDAFGPMSGIITPYQIEIIEVYYGDIQPGDILTLIKNHGVYHGFEHVVACQTSHTEGAEYILFLRRTHSDFGPYVTTLSDTQTTIPVNFSNVRNFSEEAGVLDEYSFNLLFHDCHTIDDIINKIQSSVDRLR